MLLISPLSQGWIKGQEDKVIIHEAANPWTSEQQAQAKEGDSE